jgi:hypothetical protein
MESHEHKRCGNGFEKRSFSIDRAAESRPDDKAQNDVEGGVSPQKPLMTYTHYQKRGKENDDGAKHHLQHAMNIRNSGWSQKPLDYRNGLHAHTIITSSLFLLK